MSSNRMFLPAICQPRQKSDSGGGGQHEQRTLFDLVVEGAR